VGRPCSAGQPSSLPRPTALLSAAHPLLLLPLAAVELVGVRHSSLHSQGAHLVSDRHPLTCTALQGVASDADVEPLATGEPGTVQTPADLPPATELPSASDAYSTDASDSDADGGGGGGGAEAGGTEPGGGEAPEPPAEPRCVRSIASGAACRTAALAAQQTYVPVARCSELNAGTLTAQVWHHRPWWR
jgi:hypothetical protein